MTRTDDSKMWVRGIVQETSPHDETAFALHNMSRPNGAVDNTINGSSSRCGHSSATEQADSGLDSLDIYSSEFTPSGNLTCFDMTSFPWDGESCDEDDIEVDSENVLSVTNAFGTLDIGDKSCTSFQNMDVKEPSRKRFCEGISYQSNFQRDNINAASRCDKNKIITMEDADSGNYHSFEFPSTESTDEDNKNQNVAQTPSENRLTQEQVVELYATCNKDGDNDLHTSIIKGNISIALFLIHLVPERGWLDFSNLLRQTALHLAVLTNQPTIVRSLVCAGASLEVQDKNGDTPLSIACKMGSSEIVRDLLDFVTNKGVNILNFIQAVSIRNFEGLAPLHVAVMVGDVSIVKRLLFAGSDPNVGDFKSGRTPLHFAADLGKEEMVALLVGHKETKVDFRDYSGYSAAHLAYGRGYGRVVELLLRKYNESVQNLEMAFVDSDEDDD